MKVHIEKIVNEDGDEKNLYLESDERQYILVEYKVAKSGKQAGQEVGVNLSYHPSIVSAIRTLINRKTKESTAQTLGELLEDVRRIEAYIHDLFERPKYRL